MQLNRDDLKEAYRRMCLIREFEDKVHDEFAAGNIPGFVHLYAGEEASAVGVCMHLEDRDAIASTHRGHGHCIAKGCDAKEMMSEIFGKKDGLCGGKGGSSLAGIAGLTQSGTQPNPRTVNVNVAIGGAGGSGGNASTVRVVKRVSQRASSSPKRRASSAVVAGPFESSVKTPKCRAANSALDPI